MSDDRERRHEKASREESGATRPVEQDGYVAEADEGKTAERTEEEDRAEN